MAYSSTVFHQLLQLIRRHDFDKIERHGFRPKRKYRALNRWGQFVVMMFAQLTGRSSLRDIVERHRASIPIPQCQAVSSWHPPGETDNPCRCQQKTLS